ncbi:E3 ubiquitin-protein ligase TRIM39-like isoform X2 [Centroberyx affinis]|uniref:E3 ubiquitin-protein ligase TRIM39-like isoform X2 n=1 Tax=Centroberyx affinis TaxID=166261 RepID=UPI003A5BF85F
MTSKTAERAAGSYNSFGNACKPNKSSRACRSQPFLKPLMGLQKLKDKLMKQVCRILSQAKHSSRTEPEDFSLDESKLIIRELAAELDRIVQTRKPSLLTKVTADGSCLEEQQEFILQWAEDIMQQETAGGGICSSTTDHHQMKEEVKESDQQKADEEQKLEGARKVLSGWAWSLKQTQQDSVCLDEDVCEVVQDLEKQWKRGQLVNMLPVMDFIIWSLLHPETQKGSIAKQWHRNNQRFKTRAALDHIPESVWKWISKASADITLDPSTMNPSLKLSEDRKAVKMNQIIESVNDPWDGFSRSQMKYDGWWCVLGSESYDSGRHYWEVDVRGKGEWRIGVVNESAPRHGFASLNSTTGYWTLRLQLGQLLAMTAPVTKLDRSAPSRVGVFLDMEEGQVSFYDAGQRCHIYTFDISSDDTERIYPVFGTVETDRALRILN